ncbi:hypothetical protein BBJ28_00018566 [Nothophytophthora sp. Chile5]|nr:hypothetical protein BBJ28_00018566 [Nothophytophthora sp. Chile5]
MAVGTPPAARAGVAESTAESDHETELYVVFRYRPLPCLSDVGGTHNLHSSALLIASFVAWIQLMEKQRGGVKLTSRLHMLMSNADSPSDKIWAAQQHADLMSRNDKAMSELIASINDFFHRGQAPSFNRAKTVSPPPAMPRPVQQQEDSLDRYLAHCDEYVALPSTFVNDMSGWDARRSSPQQSHKKKKTSKRTNRATASFVARAGSDQDSEGESDDEASSSDEDMTGEMWHDLLIANSVRLTSQQAPNYASASSDRPPMQQQRQRSAAGPAQAAVGSRPTALNDSNQRQNASGSGERVIVTPTAAASPATTRAKAKGKTNKRQRVVPPPIVIGASPGPTPPPTVSPSYSSGSSDVKRDRITKRNAENLEAEQVLGVRFYASANEYQIRWKGVVEPLWISRRKAPEQAQKLIDVFNSELRARARVKALVAQVAEQPASLRATKEAEAKRKLKKRKQRIARREQEWLRAAGISSGVAEREVTSETDTTVGAATPIRYIVEKIVNNRLYYNKKQYLVRWEGYDESGDTWEAAHTLRADVPAIVADYEAQLQRDRERAFAVQSAMLELSRHDATEAKRQSKQKATGKRRINDGGDEGDGGEAKKSREGGDRGMEGARRAMKRRRIAVADDDQEDEESELEEEEGDEVESDMDDEDLRLVMEEAELEEYSDEEFTDTLNK